MKDFSALKRKQAYVCINVEKLNQKVNLIFYVIFSLLCEN